MKPKYSRNLAILGAIVFTANAAFGAAITMSGDDGFGQSSFNAGTNWTGGAAPVAGNAYSTYGRLLRTPTTGSPITFAGDSLTIDPRTAESLLFKGTNTAISVADLRLNGGLIGAGDNSSYTINGAISANAVSAFTLGLKDGSRSIAINSSISGANRIYTGSLGPVGSSNYGTLTLSGDNSGFSGGFSLGGSYTNALGTVFAILANNATVKVNNLNALGTGAMEINAGTLNLNGFSPTLTTLTVPDAGSGTIRTAGNILTATSLNLGTTAGASLKIDTAGAGNPATAPIVSTNLAVNGPTTLSVLGTGLAAGTFPLIAYTGTIGGTNGFSDLSLILPPGVTGNLTDTPGSSVNVTISGVEFIKWTNGAATGNWDTTAVNWKTATGLVDTAYQQNAAGGSSVLFNESESAPSPVAIAIPAEVSPNAISINNPVKDYTFSGAGGITGSCALTKDGAGTASFSNALTFTGPTAINAGHVTLTGTNTLASGTVTVASGAFLTYNNSGNTTQGAATSSGMTLTGAGTLEKQGSSTLVFANGTGKVNWNFTAGAQIDVQGGQLTGGSNDNDVWTNNKASLNIAAGATFDGVEANVSVDSLTGSGTYKGGYYGPRRLNIGVNGGSGTFSGAITRSVGAPIGSPTLVKLGNGDQILNGTLNFQGFYGQTSLEVRGGTVADPSVLTISPTGASVVGVTSESIYFSPGANDVTEVNQTGGTLIASTLGVGENSQTTYNFSGGTVNAGSLSFAFSGGGNNGPAIMNISDTAQLNVNSNGNIRMGQYWSRAVTVNQTGGQVVQYSDAGVTRGGTGKMNFFSGNQNVTWNLEAGTLSIAGMGWNASGGGAGGGNGVLNLKGGLLQITSAAFAAPTGDANGKPKVAAKVYGDEFTTNSGARIDNYGLNVTLALPIQHGPVGVFDGGLSVENSVLGVGSLTLSGLNTYTGNTTVPTGNTLVLADNAGLTFVVDGSSNNKITGAGTVTLDGDFTLDLAYADLTDGNTWNLVDVGALTEGFGETFTLKGFGSTFILKPFTEAGTSGVHTMVDGLNTWTFDESTGSLSLDVAPATGYTLWVTDPLFGLSVGDQEPAADPDNDGVENLVEYVLDGDPTASDPSILPDLDASGANFVFSFTRREESAADTEQVFEYGTNLTGWTPINITAPTAPQVSLGTPSGGLQTVTITIPKGTNTSLFGRLKAVKP